jgi:hypothetical protein
VIVDQINVRDICSLELECNPPISGYPYSKDDDLNNADQADAPVWQTISAGVLGMITDCASKS